MGKKVKCWENFHCQEIECPVYKSRELNCWMISGTHCREEIQGKFLEKMEMCLDCKPFKKNMDKRGMEETLRIINEQFKQSREMEITSTELALGLSENFEALRKVANGDLTVRAPEKSENELLAKLGVVVNQTIAQIKNSWDKLEKSEKKYRTLTENINMGIYRNTPGPKGRFIEVNPAIVHMFGYNDKKAFLKINVSDLYKDPREREEKNEKILKNGLLKDEEVLLQKKMGHHSGDR